MGFQLTTSRSLAPKNPARDAVKRRKRPSSCIAPSKFFAEFLLQYRACTVNTYACVRCNMSTRSLMADSSTGSQSGSDRIFVPTHDRVVVVRIAEIDWVAADGNYVTLHVENKSLLLRETLGSMESRLAPHGFVRIHRATLVNMERVAELRALSTRSVNVVLRNGTELSLSRGYRAKVLAVLGVSSSPED